MKTWSREIAVVMLLFIGVLAYQEKIEMVELLIWPVVAFAIPAFGLKQEAVQGLLVKK